MYLLFLTGNYSYEQNHGKKGEIFLNNRKTKGKLNRWALILAGNFFMALGILGILFPHFMKYYESYFITTPE